MMASRFWKLGLLGERLGHSLSPSIHRAALKACGLSGDYTLVETDAHGLAGWVQELRDAEIDGLNVTIPYKESVLPLCDSLDPLAATVGAVNTLVRDGGLVRGYNTDVSGLEQALRGRWPDEPWQGQHVTVQGAGGAARAAIVALHRLGAGSIRIANRTHERARLLAHELSDRLSMPISAPADPIDAYRSSALVIQASAMGLNHDDSDHVREVAKVALAATAPDCVVMDLVYRPAKTCFVVAATECGRQAHGGLLMLIHQARDAFALWTGRDAPVEQLLGAAQAARLREQSR